MAHKVIYMKDGGLWAALLCSDEQLAVLEKSGVKIKWHELWIEGEHRSLAKLFFEDGSWFDFDFQNIDAGRPALLTREKKVHHIMPTEAKEWQGERVIFLDLDGVLNSATELFDARCVENLSKLIVWTGAKIVISSSWRMLGEDYVRKLWKEKNLPGEIVGVTPMINLPADGKARGHEIAAYVESQCVINYVIIDDDNEMLPTQQSRLVLTDGMTGLTEVDIFKAIKTLNMRNVTEYSKEEQWRKDARAHQSNFRIKRLHCDCAPNKITKDEEGNVKEEYCYGNILLDEDAERGMNFVECYREEIAEAIRSRYKISADELSAGAILTSTPLTNNMLRSEHIPYNLFYPMFSNKEALAELLRKVTGLDIASIEDSELISPQIEWPSWPGGRHKEGIEDHTAFDVFIPYRDSDANLCGIGIEVKYTEGGYKIGSGEVKKFESTDNKYHTVTLESQCFKNGEKDEPLPDMEATHRQLNEVIKQDCYRQMWRNHILGLSMTQFPVKGVKLHRFTSVHLYPEWNEHFKEEDGAVENYQKKVLTAKGRESFCPVTYEALFKAMKPIVFDPERDAEWKKYLNTRYLIK